MYDSLERCGNPCVTFATTLTVITLRTGQRGHLNLGLVGLIRAMGPFLRTQLSAVGPLIKVNENICLDRR